MIGSKNNYFCSQDCDYVFVKLLLLTHILYSKTYEFPCITIIIKTYEFLCITIIIILIYNKKKKKILKKKCAMHGPNL